MFLQVVILMGVAAIDARYVYSEPVLKIAKIKRLVDGTSRFLCFI